MRKIAIADEESRYLWDFYEPGKLKDIDLIISCGDLNPDYLMFLVTLSNVPVLYVHGNHDEKYETKPPEGCVCIEDDIFVFKGVRILGLGGSMRYRPGKHQYTDAQMNRRVRKLWWKLRRKKGFDILVTHAPAYQLNDGMDLPHQGFTAFRSLMEKYKPKYFLHGHVHLNYGRRHKRYDQYEETQVVNAFERCIIEYDETK